MANLETKRFPKQSILMTQFRKLVVLMFFKLRDPNSELELLFYLLQFVTFAERLLLEEVVLLEQEFERVHWKFWD